MSDFQTFELHDPDERETLYFALADLPAHVEAFGFILGVQRRTFRDQDPANIKAAELVGRLHDALEDAGHRGHDLERFLVRVMFCMFADDTGVFEPPTIFLDFIKTPTGEDGADLGPWLAQLFEVLDTPEDECAVTLDEDLARFPYVNGDLFKGHLRTFSFNAAMRDALLDACRFDWSNNSPANFGALFQSVMDPAERRAKGAHYTTEKNRKSTLAIADYPTKYNVEVIPSAPFLMIPEVSSERRKYAPIGWLEPPTIPSNLVRILENGS